MRFTFVPLFRFALLVLGLCVVRIGCAQEARGITIAKIVGTGSATVTYAGQNTVAAERMVLPASAEIRTTSQEIYLEITPGVVATIRPWSHIRVETMMGDDSAVELMQGTVISEIDRKRVSGKTYRVKTPQGVAAARGTAFAVSVTSQGSSITTTADTVAFTSSTGDQFTIQAGMILIAPAVGAPRAPAALPNVVANNPDAVRMIRGAVHTTARIARDNVGGLSSDSSINLLCQITAVAIAAIPSDSDVVTADVLSAVIAPGSATSIDAQTTRRAVGAVTASAVVAAPFRAPDIAAAAVKVVPAEAGVIAATAQQISPGAKRDIAERVAAVVGKSVFAVQAMANTAEPVPSIEAARNATSNVVLPAAKPNAPRPAAVSEPDAPATTPNSGAADPATSESPQNAETTPSMPIDPSINVSPAT